MQTATDLLLRGSIIIGDSKVLFKSIIKINGRASETNSKTYSDGYTYSDGDGNSGKSDNSNKYDDVDSQHP